MSKHTMGKAMAFLAGAGAAAVGIAYFVRYKSFHKELEKDFHDFEDEEFDDEGNPVDDLNNPAHRNYVSLSSSKDEFKAAAKDVKESVRVAASAAKDVIKDTAAILKDTSHEAVSAAVDTAHLASATVKDKLETYRETAEPEENAQDVPEQEEEDGTPAGRSTTVVEEIRE